MNTLVFGVRGKGKTTLGFFLATNTMRSIAVYDVSHRFNLWPEYVATDQGELENLIEHFPTVIYQPQADAWAEFGDFSEVLWGRECTLLLDEASELQSAQSRHDWLHKWVRMAPLETSDVIQTLHAPADSWSRCRSLANHWYIFETWRPADLAAIEEHCGPEVALAVTKLRGHQFIHFDVGAREMTLSGRESSWFINLDRGEHDGSLPNLRSGAARQVAV